MMQGVGSKPLGTAGNPVVVKPASPAELAKGVPSFARPRPGADDAPASNASGGDATVHAPIHIHGVSDPHRAAQIAASHVGSLTSRTHDIDAFA